MLPPPLIEKISEDLIEALRLREISLDPSRKLQVRKSDLRSVGKIPGSARMVLVQGRKGRMFTAKWIVNIARCATN